MKEIDTCNSLNEEVEGGLLSEAALFLDEHEQVTLGHILHDEVNEVAVLQRRVHSHNIHMFQLLVDLNFAFQCFPHFRRLDHTLI